MTSRKKWLHAAVRAHQAKTLDQLRRTQQAWDELFEAQRIKAIAAQDLSSLRRDWASRRHAEPSSQPLDAVYVHFHGFLSDRAARAERVNDARCEQVDAAIVELRQSHAVQRTLEKVARQTAVHLRHSAKVKEIQANAEAWLLGQVASRSGYGAYGFAGPSASARPPIEEPRPELGADKNPASLEG